MSVLRMYRFGTWIWVEEPTTFSLGSEIKIKPASEWAQAEDSAEKHCCNKVGPFLEMEHTKRSCIIHATWAHVNS